MGNKKATRDASDGSKDYSLLVYSSLLKNEILGTAIEDFKDAAAQANNQNGGTGDAAAGTAASPGMVPDRRSASAGILPASVLTQSSANNENRNLYSYKTRRMNVINEVTSPYSLTPVSEKSQKLLRSPRKASRKISKIPFKVLDAPELQDDFYLNLVDWSAQNVLSVGLGACVYLWSACTSQVTKLCDLSSDNNDTVTSVSWSERVRVILFCVRIWKLFIVCHYVTG